MTREQFLKKIPDVRDMVSRYTNYVTFGRKFGKHNIQLTNDSDWDKLQEKFLLDEMNIKIDSEDDLQLFMGIMEDEYSSGIVAFERFLDKHFS